MIALVGLCLAQHDLTQEVHILSDVIVEAGGQVTREAGTGCVDDHAAGVAAQTPLDDRHCRPVEERQVGKLLIHPEESMVRGVEELGDAILVYQFLHAACQLLRVAHLAGLIEHTDNELLVRRSGDHGAVHVLLALFGAGKPRIALVVEFPHPRENLIDSRYVLFCHNYKNR